MKCIALVIGINNYDNNTKLKNAEADALAIAEKLEVLKFKVFRLIGDIAVYDSYVKIYAELISCINIERPNAVVLYFAGHGMMANASDCLLLKDADDMYSNGGIPAKYKSIVISDVCKELRANGDQINIVIADACRREMDGCVRGGIELKDFGHNTTAPYQTFIAYSTSPGASAGDGVNGHSRYTELLLSEMGKEFQPIEVTFKNVRKGMYPKGNQLSWENTCLVDDFSFNYGQLNPYYGKLYDKTCYVRKDFHSENESFIYISDGLMNNDNTIIGKLIAEKNNLTNAEMFIIGRLVTFLYDNNPDFYEKFLSLSTIKLLVSPNGNRNDFLNGVLYELYYDAADELRSLEFPSIQLFDLLNSSAEIFEEFNNSVSFLKDSINEDDKARIPFIIGENKQITINVDIERSGILDINNNDEINYIARIYYEKGDIELNCADNEKVLVSRNELLSILHNKLKIPKNRIKIEYSGAKVNQSRILLLKMNNFEQQLAERLRSDNWNDIDSLGTMAYVEEVYNIYLTDVYKSGIAVIAEGSCTSNIHIEMDHEIWKNINLPCKFKVVLMEIQNIWCIDRLYEPNFDTSGFYQ